MIRLPWEICYSKIIIIITICSKSYEVFQLEMGEIKDEAEKIEILKKSDVYAVGVLIHEILLNKAPKLWKNEHMRELDINVS